MKLTRDEDLINYINTHIADYDAIVVEGYDGVGKGRVLTLISNLLEIEPYRPDYNLWQKYDHRVIDRWKVSGFFWDVFSHFYRSSDKVLLFDRGVLSGAVYNEDPRILEDYRKILRNMRVLHILVSCSAQDYLIFQQNRNPNLSADELKESVIKYWRYEMRYRDYLERSGLEYIRYINIYDKKFYEESLNTCLGCGHYNHGVCRHPEINREVDAHSIRCSKSYDSEVQDNELYVMSPQC